MNIGRKKNGLERFEPVINLSRVFCIKFNFKYSYCRLISLKVCININIIAMINLVKKFLSLDLNV